MADGHFPTLVSKDRNVNALANPILIQLSDGTAAAGFTGSSLNVNITGGASSGTEFAEDSAAADGALGSLVLVVRKDTIASNVTTDGDYATLLQDGNGRLYTQIHDGGNTITVDGTVTANAGTGPFPVSDNGGSLTVDAVALDIRTITKATDSIQISKDTAANASGNPIFVDISAQTVTALKVSATAAVNSPTNPIYVQTVDVGVLSNEVHSYDTSSAIASDTADNHDYTVTGTTFLLREVVVSSSGGSKFEIQTGPVGTLATILVGFIPKEGGTMVIPFNPPREVPVTSTGTVRVIRTNRQGQAQDLYSTIMGNDVA